jgi:hypothetical protein
MCARQLSGYRVVFFNPAFSKGFRSNPQKSPGTLQTIGQTPEQITWGCMGRHRHQRRFLSTKTALHNVSGPQQQVICFKLHNSAQSS